MTIEQSRTAERDVGKIIRRAYRIANLISEHQGLSTSKTNEGLDLLSDVIDSLETEGIFARSVGFENITMVVGQREYGLGKDVLGVRGTPIYVPAGEDPEAPNSPTYMRMVTREEWQRLSNKDEESSRPVLAFEDRQGAPITLNVWQLPSEEGTVRLQVHRLRADTTQSASTVDFERYWVQYLVHQLGHELALQNGVDLKHVEYVGQLAAMYLQKCKGRANETPAPRFRMGHRTPWSR